MLFKEISTTGAVNAVWGNFKSLGSLCHLRRYHLQESWIKCGNLKCFKSFQTAQAIHYFKYHSPAINIMVQTFFIIKQRKQHKGCQWEECHLDKNVGRREVPVFLQITKGSVAEVWFLEKKELAQVLESAISCHEILPHKRNSWMVWVDGTNIMKHTKLLQIDEIMFH